MSEQMIPCCPACGLLWTTETRELAVRPKAKGKAPATITAERWTVTCGGGHTFEVLASARHYNRADEYRVGEQVEAPDA